MQPIHSTAARLGRGDASYPPAASLNLGPSPQPIETEQLIKSAKPWPSGDASFPRNPSDASPNLDRSSQPTETEQLKTLQIIFRPSRQTCVTRVTPRPIRTPPARATIRTDACQNHSPEQRTDPHRRRIRDLRSKRRGIWPCRADGDFAVPLRALRKQALLRRQSQPDELHPRCGSPRVAAP